MEALEGKMTEDEKYVREHTEWVHCCDGSYQDYPRGTILTQSAPGGAKDRKEFDLWSSAAAYWRTRLQQIRDVEEDIGYIEWDQTPDSTCGVTNCAKCAAYRRILAREQAALADLKRGLRVAEERTK